MDEDKGAQEELKVGESVASYSSDSNVLDQPSESGHASYYENIAGQEQLANKKINPRWLWISLLVLVLAGLGMAGWFFFTDDGPSDNAKNSTSADEEPIISSYEECVAAGHPIMEIYPEQCAVPDGPTFTRQLTPEEQAQLDADAESVLSVDPGINNSDGSFVNKIVSGYVTTTEWKEAFCESSCPIDEVAFFVITEEPDSVISNFIAEREGNSFVMTNPPSLAIGCVNPDGTLSYSSYKAAVDGFQNITISFTEEETTKLLSSSVGSPVFLELSYQPADVAKSAGNCYGHMTSAFLLD